MQVFKIPGGQSGPVPWFEFHLGPGDEFAIFAGKIGEEEHLEHDGKRNLLPAYHFKELPTVWGTRNWAVDDLGIALSVMQLPEGGPEGEGCLSFLVLLQRTHPIKWALR